MRRYVTRLRLLLLVVISCPLSTALGQDENQPIELTLTPRAVEQPILKHRLLPAEFELKDGNAATIILRMIWEQQSYMQKVFGTFDDDLELALDDPKILENGAQGFDSFYPKLRRAAYRRTAEWQYPIDETPTAYILLPDVQGGREFAGKELSVWIRYHIAKGDLDQAREGILVGLAVARHYSRTPFMIIQLVSQAIDSMMLDRVVEMVAQPECPNLYWSLTVLPKPLLSSQPSVEFEERFLESTLQRIPQLDGEDDFKAHPSFNLDRLDVDRSTEEWERIAQGVVRIYLETGRNSADTVEGRELLAIWAKQGRNELPDMMPLGVFDRLSMSDTEAGLRWFLMKHRALSQEITAMMALEPKQALPVLRDLQLRIKAFREQTGMDTLFNLENPLNLYLAVRRNDRRIAMLRIVEGIRHYAATHEGKLPRLLIDLQETPAPNDPMLDQPFEYSVKGDEALLSASDVPTIDSKIPGVQYRIRLRESAD